MTLFNNTKKVDHTEAIAAIERVLESNNVFVLSANREGRLSAYINNLTKGEIVEMYASSLLKIAEDLGEHPSELLKKILLSMMFSESKS